MKRWPVLLVACLLGIGLIGGVGVARGEAIPLDYPKRIIDDSPDLGRPGVPSDDPDLYPAALAASALGHRLPLSTAMARHLNMMPPLSGLDAPVDVAYTDDRGGSRQVMLFDHQRPLWRLLRDARFLRTFQGAVARWRSDYLRRLSPGAQIAIRPEDAWRRGLTLYRDYLDYAAGAGADGTAASPLAAVLIGPGLTLYGDYINSSPEDDGPFQPVDGPIQDVLAQGATTFNGGMPGLLEMSMDRAPEAVMDAAAAFYASPAPDLAILFSMARSGLFDAATGGASLAFAPPEILTHLPGNVGAAPSDLTRAAHLIAHFHLTTRHATVLRDQGTALFDQAGVIDFGADGARFRTFVETYLAGAMADDPILTALYEMAPSVGAAPAVAEARALYAISGLLAAAEGLDMDRIEGEINAAALMRYYADADISLAAGRSDAGIHAIRLPEIYRTQAETGEPAGHISWNWKPVGAPDTEYQYLLDAAFAVAVTVTEKTENGQPAALTLDPRARVDMRRDLDIRALVVYPDDSRITGAVALDYRPPHDTVHLYPPSSPEFPMGEARTLYATISGSYPEEIWVSYRPRATDPVPAPPPDPIPARLDQTAGDFTTHYTFDFTTPRVEAGDYDIWVTADGKNSAPVTVTFRNPDTDGDGLGDAWERAFFGSLSPTPGADPDADGKVHFVEYNENTHPGEADPMAEILAPLVLAPAPDAQGETVFAPKGPYYTHLELTGGVLDLEGDLLVIHGNLLQSGGDLTPNGGRVIVDGDYRLVKKDGSDSDGRLIMTDPADAVTVKGDLLFQSCRDHSSLLTAGALDVAGDVAISQTLGCGGALLGANFKTGGDHETRLTGDGLRAVSVDHPGADRARFMNLTISAPVSLTGDLVIAGELTMAAGGSLENGRLIPTGGASAAAWPGDLHVDAASAGWTLTADQTVAGDLYLWDRFIDLSGHTLAVNGRFIHAGGTLLVNGGHLSVHGDYRIEGLTDQGLPADSAGLLAMTGPEDRVTTGGDFIMRSHRDHSGSLVSGVLTVGGDFLQMAAAAAGGDDPAANFAAGGDHRVVLASDVSRTIRLATPGLNQSRFQNLELTGAGQVVLDSPLAVAGTLIPGDAPISGEGALLGGGDLAIYGGRWPHAMRIDAPEAGWRLTETMRVDGDLYLVAGVLDMAGFELTVGGNLIHSGGQLVPGGGTLLVTGDYLLWNPDTAGGDSQGLLSMTQAGDTVRVTGDFITQSAVDHAADLTAGALILAGDFTQKAPVDTDAPAGANFMASGDFRVALAGEAAQVLRFETPGHDKARFRFLSLENTGGGVLMATDAVVTGGLAAAEGAALSGEGHVVATGAMIIDEAGWPHDLYVSRLGMGWRLPADQTIGGDLFLMDGTVDLDGRALKIDGHLIQTGGALRPNAGRLTVGGDYWLGNPGAMGEAIYAPALLNMTRTEDRVSVGGDFVMQSCLSHTGLLTAGTLDIGGNFTQSHLKLCDAGAPGSNFDTMGDFKVVLSAAGDPVARFENPSMAHFQILEITDGDAGSLSLITPVVVTRSLIAPPGLLVAGASHMIPSGAAELVNGWPRDITVGPPGADWTLQSDTTIGGWLFFTGGRLDLNGFTLTVSGDMIHSAGDLLVNGGHLEVMGNYLIRRPEPNGGFSASDGRLTMWRPEDRVTVGGDFFMQSCRNHGGWLNDGILTVKGDFFQRMTTLCGNAEVGTNFDAGGNHQVILAGESEQRVWFYSPPATPAGFNILILENTAWSGVIFETTVTVETLFDHKGNHFTLTQPGYFADFDGDGYPDYRDAYPRDPAQWDAEKPGYGNVNDDAVLDLADALIALRVAAGIGVPVDLNPAADVDGNDRIDLAEAIFVLETLSGLRP